MPLILIAEDDAILALDLEDGLRKGGFEVAGPFATCEAVEHWLTTGTPDVALLDIALRGGRCHRIAEQLQQRGVPYLVCSGSLGHEDDPVFRDARRVAKPIRFVALMKLLAAALGTST